MGAAYLPESLCALLCDALAKIIHMANVGVPRQQRCRVSVGVGPRW